MKSVIWDATCSSVKYASSQVTYYSFQSGMSVQLEVCHPSKAVPFSTARCCSQEACLYQTDC